MAEGEDSSRRLMEIIEGDSAKDFGKYQEEISFFEYLEKLRTDARPARTAFQRLYDMVIGAGTERVKEFGDELEIYNFFCPKSTEGKPTKDAIFGLERPLMELVGFFKNAAYELGAEKRILLLHGPVGSAKSTISSLLKRGLEAYSKTDENALYSLKWVNLEGKEFAGMQLFDNACEMREDPIKLLLPHQRDAILAAINENNCKNPDSKMKYELRVDKDLCSPCQLNMNMLMKEYKGDWKKVMENHIRVYRLVLSETSRVGIGTFQPKDEKNQDSTDLTGDVNFRKLAKFGSDSDPRAFNFDGEFCVANRGMMEFIEVLKLDVAFLYDLLGASQERLIKPKKFPQTSLDTVLIGHTNEAEFKKLRSNEFMEAMRDRTNRIDIPYTLKLGSEQRIYTKTFDAEYLKNLKKHIAPHTIEIASMWAIMTRMEVPNNQQLKLIQKLQLYDGKTVKDFGPEFVKRLQNEAEREGLVGVSPRFIQDSLGDAACSHLNPCVDPFMVLDSIKKRLKRTLMDSELVNRYKGPEVMGEIEGALEEMIKADVGRAISGDETAIKETFEKYIHNVEAYVTEGKVKNSFGTLVSPDEKFMQAVEIKMDITDPRKDEWRNKLMNRIATKLMSGGKFEYNSNDQLRAAIEMKLFDDTKDTIDLLAVLAGNEDTIAEGKNAIILSRLTERGYCSQCAKKAMLKAHDLFSKK
ncbi:MAG: serine protein kinase [Candidatus Nanoarchaeia archaeon]|jgi:serine protein kinase